MAANSDSGFTADERAAMKERAREIKLEAKRAATRETGLADIHAKIAEMDAQGQVMAKRIHDLITEAVPDLMPRTWYGMPAYTKASGKAVVFFQDAGKFDSRYSTLGFQDAANLDDESGMWSTSYAVVKLTPEVERRIVELVKQAAS